MTFASSAPSPCYSFALSADLDPIMKQRFYSVKIDVKQFGTQLTRFENYRWRILCCSLWWFPSLTSLLEALWARRMTWKKQRDSLATAVYLKFTNKCLTTMLTQKCINAVNLISENWKPAYSITDGHLQNFVSVFSVYFPASIGILTGANVSGDLKVRLLP